MNTTQLIVHVDCTSWDNHFPRAEVQVNNVVAASAVVTGPTTLSVSLDDIDDCTYNIKICLANKTLGDTVVENGEVIKDTLLHITDVTLDNISIQNMMFDRNKYCHNYNGTGDNTAGPYTGVMGCNGYTELNITTPIHLWVLENT